VTAFRGYSKFGTKKETLKFWVFKKIVSSRKINGVLEEEEKLTDLKMNRVLKIHQNLHNYNV
jgi:hypothetical protein